MSEFNLSEFINNNPELLGEGVYKNYLLEKARIDLITPTQLKDVGLSAEKVLGQSEYINYVYSNNLKK